MEETLETTKFKLKQVLAMIESNLVTLPNSSEFQFYLDLKEELTVKLKVMEDGK